LGPNLGPRATISVGDSRLSRNGRSGNPARLPHLSIDWGSPGPSLLAEAAGTSRTLTSAHTNAVDLTGAGPTCRSTAMAPPESQTQPPRRLQYGRVHDMAVGWSSVCGWRRIGERCKFPGSLVAEAQDGQRAKPRRRCAPVRTGSAGIGDDTRQ
jgi:hypothetical protein